MQSVVTTYQDDLYSKSNKAILQNLYKLLQFPWARNRYSSHLGRENLYMDIIRIGYTFAWILVWLSLIICISGIERHHKKAFVHLLRCSRLSKNSFKPLKLLKDDTKYFSGHNKCFPKDSIKINNLKPLYYSFPYDMFLVTGLISFKGIILP